MSFDQPSYTVDEGQMLPVMVTIDPMCSIENDDIVNISSSDGTAGIAIVDCVFGSLTTLSFYSGWK